MCSEGSGWSEDSAEGLVELTRDIIRRLEGQRRDMNGHRISIYDPIENWMASKGEWRVKVRVACSMRGWMGTGWRMRAHGRV